jgi:hypothetical protein
VWPHVHAVSWRKARRPELINEDEGPDHRPALGGQGASNREVAKVVSDRSDGLHRRVSSIRLNHKNSLQGKPVIAGQTKNHDISTS